MTPRQLAGPRFRRLWPRTYVAATLELTFAVWLQAAYLILPTDAAASHLTALRVWGLTLRPGAPMHFSTNTSARRHIKGLVLHRRTGPLQVHCVDGFRVLGPDRTYVDNATILTLVELVQAAEHLLHAGHTTYAVLSAYLERTHIDGVVRARRAFAYVREGVESPMETLVRLALVFARLPEPEPNPDVLDATGRLLGRCDLVFWTHRVVVEYDGAWHAKSRKQRAYDRTRRENIERNHWKVIVVLDDDLPRMKSVVWRVYTALKENGYDGPRPHFNAMWIG